MTDRRQSSSQPCASPITWTPLAMLATYLRLGDARLDRRAVKLASDCLPAAKGSLAAMFGTDRAADQKRAQEFMSNPNVGLRTLRDGLYCTTLSSVRRQKIKSVISVFDPTLLDFSGQDFKKDRKAIGDGRGLGFTWLNSVLVDPNSKRVLGVAHQTLVSAHGPDDAEWLDYAPGIVDPDLRVALESNSKQAFCVHSAAVDSRMDSDVEVIHVADREFDDGLTLRERRSAGRPNSHFVIRGLDSRVVEVQSKLPWLPEELWLPSRNGKVARPNANGLVRVRINELAAKVPTRLFRNLSLDSRGRVCFGDQRKVAHTAALEIGAIEIRLARRSARALRAGIPEEPVTLNLVVVRKTNPRAGKKPLQWLLLTDLAITTCEEVDRVADTYVCRWRIEEFFRTTKDAMKLESSELDDAESTARLLLFVTLKAMFLDDLREAADIQAGAPLSRDQARQLVKAADRAQEIEARRVKGAKPPKTSPRERAVMVLGVVARKGKWAARSGDHLGNYVLLRGLPIFLHDVAEDHYAWLFEESKDTGS